ncbi:MAG: hypothetical protein EZS28_005249 [Streblomastix strix]|uniref:RecF/RecN/SMC N-terminal domain-containing protein n=1 Tax=Streblomastix strix TaxID=222440 RepID=A0A5J4WXD9_9EUKA|nr:MAG: hypothetical protein EZS28_005249 [Streblomastix strix]
MENEVKEKEQIIEKEMKEAKREMRAIEASLDQIYIENQQIEKKMQNITQEIEELEADLKEKEESANGLMSTIKEDERQLKEKFGEEMNIQLKIQMEVQMDKNIENIEEEKEENNNKEEEIKKQYKMMIKDEDDEEVELDINKEKLEEKTEQGKNSSKKQRRKKMIIKDDNDDEEEDKINTVQYKDEVNIKNIKTKQSKKNNKNQQQTFSSPSPSITLPTLIDEYELLAQLTKMNSEMGEIAVDIEGRRSQLRMDLVEESKKCEEDMTLIRERDEKLATVISAAQDELSAQEEERMNKLTAAVTLLNSHYSRIYRLLTDDEGDAQLTSHTSSKTLAMRMGIGMMVRPPSSTRVWVDFSQLSGGQQSLASIALLLAFHAAFPGPFILMDEVEGALDATYAARVADVLRTGAVFGYNDDINTPDDIDEDDEDDEEYLPSFHRPQLIIVTLRRAMYAHSPVVVGCFHLNGSTHTASVEFITQMQLKKREQKEIEKQQVLEKDQSSENQGLNA